MPSKSRRNAIIIATIGAAAIIIGAWIQGCFSKPVAKSQIEQNNNRDVKNEFNEGGKTENNYYNTTKEEKQRHLSNEDILRIKNTIPSRFSIKLNFPNVDKEAYNYAMEINNHLQSMGYKVELITNIAQISDAPNERFQIEPILPNTNYAVISVFRLREV